MQNTSGLIMRWSLVFRILAPVAYACLISYFSHQSLTGGDSTLPLSWLEFGWSDKALHALEFFGFTIILGFSFYKRQSLAPRFLMVFLIATVFAWVDEIHQIFIQYIIKYLKLFELLHTSHCLSIPEAKTTGSRK